MDTDDGQLLKLLITHFHSRLFEGASLPSPQQQLIAIVNVTADDAVVKIAQLLAKRLLVLSEFSM